MLPVLLDQGWKSLGQERVFRFLGLEWQTANGKAASAAAAAAAAARR